MGIEAPNDAQGGMRLFAFTPFKRHKGTTVPLQLVGYCVLVWYQQLGSICFCACCRGDSDASKAKFGQHKVATDVGLIVLISCAHATQSHC